MRQGYAYKRGIVLIVLGRTLSRIPQCRGDDHARAKEGIIKEQTSRRMVKLARGGRTYKFWQRRSIFIPGVMKHLLGVAMQGVAQGSL